MVAPGIKASTTGHDPTSTGDIPVGVYIVKPWPHGLCDRLGGRRRLHVFRTEGRSRIFGGPGFTYNFIDPTPIRERRRHAFDWSFTFF